jgi:hypothetical protein|tara:strand:- start:2533 stop:2772 length:240 start_codon:yes stop_codon:yes gene_type:complete
MEVPPLLFWNIILTIGIGPLYWFIKRIANDLDRLEKKVTDDQIELPRKYVAKEDHHRDISDIKGMLKEIYGLLRDGQKK